MKTNNTHMKTRIMKTSMLLATLILMGTGVFASDKNQPNANTSGASNDSEQTLSEGNNLMLNLAFVLEETPEETLKIEDWMINLNNDRWNIVNEEKIPLEKWMYDLTDERWSTNDDQKEERIPLEPWMYDLSQWKLSK